MITQIQIQNIPYLKRLLVLKCYGKSIENFANNRLDKAIFWIKASLMICPFWEDLWLKHLELLFKKKKMLQGSCRLVL